MDISFIIFIIFSHYITSFCLYIYSLFSYFCLLQVFPSLSFYIISSVITLAAFVSLNLLYLNIYRFSLFFEMIYFHYFFYLLMNIIYYLLFHYSHCLFIFSFIRDELSFVYLLFYFIAELFLSLFLCWTCFLFTLYWYLYFRITYIFHIFPLTHSITLLIIFITYFFMETYWLFLLLQYYMAISLTYWLYYISYNSFHLYFLRTLH